LKIPSDDMATDVEWVSTRRGEGVIDIVEKEVIDNLTPDVVGMCLKDAIFLLENVGLKVVVNGRGTVRRQSIQPGTRVRRGENVVLEMSMG